MLEWIGAVVIFHKILNMSMDMFIFKKKHFQWTGS
jgi:hypothetical protein